MGWLFLHELEQFVHTRRLIGSFLDSLQLLKTELLNWKWFESKDGLHIKETTSQGLLGVPQQIQTQWDTWIHAIKQPLWWFCADSASEQGFDSPKIQVKFAETDTIIPRALYQVLLPTMRKSATSSIPSSLLGCFAVLKSAHNGFWKHAGRGTGTATHFFAWTIRN